MEHRHNCRHTTKHPVSLIYQDHQPIEGICRDISREGLQIETDDTTLPNNAAVRVVFKGDETMVGKEIRAIVIHRREGCIGMMFTTQPENVARQS
ncbi:hypothetical protein BOW53_09180 [Solemya pervernicosa gill symbiont]|uniref:PilZ domain-containing protein n=2 Tax=Gammaproteobacteria incertae sedis TaxID=118884 RepID=A0A1T2L4N8_9GAMM|nr:PilZ domain-containing protein [Candidatus Reidiella endopervernicosa]OOZ40059.1 hypothetical protein BOW53_09180 [Solemya pervernicosa gill symbiont]QKQ27643.1 PilZ domain-containing protein [Candidatus Reidiella endopervernicosa]